MLVRSIRGTSYTTCLHKTVSFDLGECVWCFRGRGCEGVIHSRGYENVLLACLATNPGDPFARCNCDCGVTDQLNNRRDRTRRTRLPRHFHESESLRSLWKLTSHNCLPVDRRWLCNADFVTHACICNNYIFCIYICKA